MTCHRFPIKSEKNNRKHSNVSTRVGKIRYCRVRINIIVNMCESVTAKVPLSVNMHVNVRRLICWCIFYCAAPCAHQRIEQTSKCCLYLLMVLYMSRVIGVRNTMLLYSAAPRLIETSNLCKLAKETVDMKSYAQHLVELLWAVFTLPYARRVVVLACAMPYWMWIANFAIGSLSRGMRVSGWHHDGFEPFALVSLIAPCNGPSYGPCHLHCRLTTTHH